MENFKMYIVVDGGAWKYICSTEEEAEECVADYLSQTGPLHKNPVIQEKVFKDIEQAMVCAYRAGESFASWCNSSY